MKFLFWLDLLSAIETFIFEILYSRQHTFKFNFSSRDFPEVLAYLQFPSFCIHSLLFFDAKLIKYNRNIGRNVTCQTETALAAQVRLGLLVHGGLSENGCCIAFNYNADIDMIGSYHWLHTHTNDIYIKNWKKVSIVENLKYAYKYLQRGHRPKNVFHRFGPLQPTAWITCWLILAYTCE